LLAVVLAAGAERSPAAEPAGLPSYLYDRGDGIPTSLFGTYVREKELLVYTFYEYTRSKNFEYQPSELGFTGDNSFFGKAVEQEYLLFLAYGFSDSLAVEFESALHSSVDFRKDPSDTSNVPGRIRESGLGDTEINIRWRFLKETAARPEATFFFKTVFPLQKSKKLLGTPDWEFEPGIVLTKGFSFGTLALRSSLDEYAVDYVKRLSQNWAFPANHVMCRSHSVGRATRLLNSGGHAPGCRFSFTASCQFINRLVFTRSAGRA